MAFRSKLLGLDDELIQNLPSVADTARDLTDAARTGLASGLATEREAPPTPIDPWADAPGLAASAPASPRLASDDAEDDGNIFGRATALSAPSTPRPPTFAAPIALRGRPAAPRYAPDELVDDSGLLTGAVEDRPTPLAGLDTSAQPPETQGQAKSLPGLFGFDPFGTTADESKALERAGTRDRRLRIAQGVIGGLGGLTQALGASIGGANSSFAGLGAGLNQGATGNYATNVNDVRGQIQQRQAQDMRRMQYGQAQEDRALAQADRASERERQAAQDALNTEYRRAQIGNIGAQAAERQQQVEGEQSNANALREFIRANVQSMDPRNPTRARWEAMMQRPGFDTATSEALMQIDDSMGGLMRTRAFANSGGRIGSSSSSSTVVDPVTGARIRVRSGGRGARGAGGPAPAPRPSGGPAPAPGAPVATPPAGAPLDVSEDSLTETIAAGMRAEGIDPTSESGQRMLRAEVATLLHGPSAGAQADPLADARERLRQRAIADIGGLPPGVTEQSLARIPAEAVKMRGVSEAYSRFLHRVDTYHSQNPAAFQLAVSTADIQNGPGATAVDLAAFRIRQDLQSQINQVLSRISGANVTPNEMERNLRALGVGTFATNYDVVRRAFADRQNEVDDTVMGFLGRVDPRTADYWLGMSYDTARAVANAPAAAAAPPAAPGPAATGGQ